MLTSYLNSRQPGLAKLITGSGRQFLLHFREPLQKSNNLIEDF